MLFPVEWGIFAFSSFIIHRKQKKKDYFFKKRPFGKQMCFGDECCHLRRIVIPTSSRGVLKWHSLLKVHLAIIDFDFSARVTVEIGKRLARSLLDAEGPGNAFKRKRKNVLLSQPDRLVYRVCRFSVWRRHWWWPLHRSRH